MSAGVAIGDMLSVLFPSQRPAGHEQVGPRPAVVVGIPDRAGSPRFPSLVVVPFTTNEGEHVTGSPALYPVFKAGVGGLTSNSVALVDNVRSVGVSRILGRMGSLTPEQYAPIKAALKLTLDF